MYFRGELHWLRWIIVESVKSNVMMQKWLHLHKHASALTFRLQSNSGKEWRGLRRAFVPRYVALTVLRQRLVGLFAAVAEFGSENPHKQISHKSKILQKAIVP